jgi:hypothetical protein
MRRFALGVLCSIALVAGGCSRQSSQPTSTPDPGVQIEVENLNEPQRTGDVTLIVTVRDALGGPVDGAKVGVRGDMSHAGMMPSLGSVDGGHDGRYDVPFTWTMGGDWILEVTATLPDGSTTTRRFNLTVSSP